MLTGIINKKKAQMCFIKVSLTGIPVLEGVLTYSLSLSRYQTSHVHNTLNTIVTNFNGCLYILTQEFLIVSVIHFLTGKKWNIFRT